MQPTTAHNTPSGRWTTLFAAVAIALMGITSAALAQVLLPDNDAHLVLNGDSDDLSDPTVTNQLGNRVASAGDFNGDGLDDVIVTDPSDEHATGRGSAYIYFGGASGVLFDPDATADVVLRGFGQFPSAVASAGDFNGDGLSDVVVGWAVDSRITSAAGSALVFFGRQQASQLVLDANDADIVITGRLNGNLGTSVDGLGDYDGDGLADIVISEFAHQTGSVCDTRAYVVFGRPTASQIVLDAAAESDVVIQSGVCNTGFGLSASSAGDFDGDGLGDVIVGAFSTPGGGAAYIFYGGRSGMIDEAESQADVVLEGEISGQGGNVQFGLSVASAGDMNGDGLGDVVVGDNFYFAGAGAGGAFVFFGGHTGVVSSTDADLIVGMSGDATAGDLAELGRSVASAGDFNDDGLSDVIVGAAGVQCEGCTDLAGAAYIFFGPRTGVFSDPEVDADVVFHGQDVLDVFGRSVATAGDFDGDGASDVVIGATGDDNTPGTNSGAAYVFRGSPGAADGEPPVVRDAGTDPRRVLVGDELLLFATVDDSLTGGSVIQSASYTIGGITSPMTPADGLFDSEIEKVVATVTPGEAGLVEICVAGTDAAGNTSDPECLTLEVSEPGDGFVTGGGFVLPPDIVCSWSDACDAADGKVSFGFVVKSKRKSSVPRGNLQLNFQHGGFRFHARTFEWLLTDDARASFQGSGRINGEGDYGFRVELLDAGRHCEHREHRAADGRDRLRIRIWERTSGAIVFDTEPGHTLDAEPTTPLAGGQIVIHR